MAKKNGKQKSNGDSAFHLEADIEIPATSRVSKYPWAQMEVGESFALAPGKKGASAYSSAKRNGLKVKIAPDPKNPDQKRVWRVE